MIFNFFKTNKKPALGDRRQRTKFAFSKKKTFDGIILHFEWYVSIQEFQLVKEWVYDDFGAVDLDSYKWVEIECRPALVESPYGC